MNKILRLLQLIIILTIAPTLYAANHMIIMGGSGDPLCEENAVAEKNKKPFCESTIFDTSLGLLGASLKGVNWNTSIAFDGGHAKTEAQLRRDFGKNDSPVPEFNEENYLKMIKTYKEKILRGEITSSDQIVLMINTHGAAKTMNEKTHLVASGRGEAVDLKNLKGAKNISLDSLEELVALTNQKGIKLGIIDFSCHSGSTLALKRNAPNTCIITATGPELYAYAGKETFSSKFMQYIKPGKSLESVFLNARLSSSGPDFPMISTDEAAQINAEIYFKILPYLYYSEPKEDKLSDYLYQNSNEFLYCVQESQFQKLIEQINSLEKISTRVGGVKSDLQDLKLLIEQYQELQKALKKRVQKFGDISGELGMTFTSPFTYMFKGKKEFSSKNLTLSISDILSTDFDKLINEFTLRAKNSTSEFSKSDALCAVENYKKAKLKQTEMKKENSLYKNFEIEASKIRNEMAKTKDLAMKIAWKEKTLYDELYKQKQSLNMDEPCKRITF